MKSVWSILSVLAVANLLALAGFVGWLGVSDRLDMPRVREVRTLFAPTLSEQDAAEKAEAAKAEAAAAAAEDAVKASRVPLTASELLAARIEATEIDRQRTERLRREVEDLQARLSAERTHLESQRAQLSQDRKVFEEMVAASQGALVDTQFQKTLSVLQALKPADAMAMLQQILATGSTGVPVDASAGGVVGETGVAALSATDPVRMRQVVAYVDAMDERPRVKVMTEFVKADPRLAAELLENLRKRADFARVP